MFEHTVVGVQDESHQPWTLAVSFLVQCLLLSLGILIPLIYTETLPGGQWVAQLLAPLPLAAPRTPAPSAASAAPVRQSPIRLDDSFLRQPARIPASVALVDDSTRSAPSISALETPFMVQGAPGGVWGAFGGRGSVPAIAVPPPEPVQAPKLPVTSAPVQVGGDVQAAKLINRTMPKYPYHAKYVRVQGLVRLEAIIGEDGTIQKLRALSGHPLLVPAALAAVKRWRYRPTLLNGRPVPVITQVEVRFTLRG
jgi:protein TonB